MTVVPAVYFLALYAVPALHALLLTYVQSERVARRVAQAGALLSALACGGMLFLGQQRGTPLYASVALPSMHVTVRLLFDARSAPFLAVLGLSCFAWTLGPRAGRTSLRHLLWLEAALCWLFTAGDFVTFALAFFVVLVPAQRVMIEQAAPRQHGLLRRLFVLHHGLGVLALLSACLAVDPRVFGVSLLSLDASFAPEAHLPWLASSFALVVCTRMAIFPLHTWLPAALERGGLTGVTLLASLHTGAYFLVRLLPLVEGQLDWLRSLALVSALYGALLALGQHDLRRLLGSSFVIQSSLMLAHLLAHPDASRWWLAASVATTGLALMVAALGARTGAFDMRELGAAPSRVPALAASFLFFAVAALLPVLAQAHPAGAVLALQGLALSRAFIKTFVAPGAGSTDAAGIMDLRPQEWAVVGLLAVVTVGAVVQALCDPDVKDERAIGRAHHRERAALSNVLAGGAADDCRAA